jgi:multiple sugar transport system substrate-binding protein
MKATIVLYHRFCFIASMLLLLFSLSVEAQDIITTLRVVSLPYELSEDEIASFEEANPDIKIELLDWQTFSYDTAVALGEIPDVMRVQATDMPALVQEGLVQDLTPYFEASDRIRIDDFASATNYYRFDDHYYGLPKDWSLDFSLYVYNPAFEAAGIPIPNTEEPLTYAEVANLAQQLTMVEGETVIQYGFYTYFLERTIASILTQRDHSLFTDNYTEMHLVSHPADDEMHLVDNHEALEVIHFFYDMALNDSMYPYTSSSSTWKLIIEGQIAIFQYGYWFGGAVTEDMPIYDQLTMLPAPTWDRELPRLNTTIGPVGMVISSSTQHPDEAYRFFEWYTVGEASVERAEAGWGAPNLLSQFDLLPQDTEFDRQRLSVLQSELPYSDWILPIYPYQGIITTFSESWNRNIELARIGEVDFDIFVSNLQEAINLAILNEQTYIFNRLEPFDQ